MLVPKGELVSHLRSVWNITYNSVYNAHIGFLAGSNVVIYNIYSPWLFGSSNLSEH